MKVKIIILYCVFLCLSETNAQQDFVMYHMPSIPQITQVDPASIPDSKIDIGLPIISRIYGSVFNTGFSFNDLFYKTPSGSTMADMENAIKKMKPNNFLVLNFSTDLLFLGFKHNKDYYSFNVTEKVDYTFNYPEDLVTMALEGNGRNLLGRRASFDGLGMDFTHWREYAFHWAHDVNHKFSYGARIKYLYGMENFTTKISNMGIHTDQQTHALTFDMTFEFRTSGLPLLMIDDSTKGIGAIDMSSNEINQEAGFEQGFYNNYYFGRKNRGVGIDIGFNYHINDKLLLEGSLLDIGFIRWKSYTSNSSLSQWNYTYSGIENPIEMFGGSGTSVQFLKEILEDSVENALRNNFTYSNPTYHTSLRTKFYASMEYIVDHNNFVSLTTYSSFIRNRFRIGVGLAYNYHFKHWLSATASYAIYNRSYSNIGIGFSANAGPAEFFLMTDNILAVFMPENVKNTLVNFGFNLTFGREKPDNYKEEPASMTSSDKKKSGKKRKKSNLKDVKPQNNTPRKVTYKL